MILIYFNKGQKKKHIFPKFNGEEEYKNKENKKKQENRENKGKISKNQSFEILNYPISVGIFA